MKYAIRGGAVLAAVAGGAVVVLTGGLATPLVVGGAIAAAAAGGVIGEEGIRRYKTAYENDHPLIKNISTQIKDTYKTIPKGFAKMWLHAHEINKSDAYMNCLQSELLDLSGQNSNYEYEELFI